MKVYRGFLSLVESKIRVLFAGVEYKGSENPADRNMGLALSLLTFVSPELEMWWRSDSRRTRPFLLREGPHVASLVALRLYLVTAPNGTNLSSNVIYLLQAEILFHTQTKTDTVSTLKEKYFLRPYLSAPSFPAFPINLSCNSVQFKCLRSPVSNIRAKVCHLHLCSQVVFAQKKCLRAVAKHLKTIFSPPETCVEIDSWISSSGCHLW